jgi:hypothetical protein
MGNFTAGRGKCLTLYRPSTPHSVVFIRVFIPSPAHRWTTRHIDTYTTPNTTHAQLPTLPAPSGDRMAANGPPAGGQPPAPGGGQPAAPGGGGSSGGAPPNAGAAPMGGPQQGGMPPQGGPAGRGRGMPMHPNMMQGGQMGHNPYAQQQVCSCRTLSCSWTLRLSISLAHSKSPPCRLCTTDAPGAVPVRDQPVRAAAVHAAADVRAADVRAADVRAAAGWTSGAQPARWQLRSSAAAPGNPAGARYAGTRLFSA